MFPDMDSMDSPHSYQPRQHNIGNVTSKETSLWVSILFTCGDCVLWLECVSQHSTCDPVITTLAIIYRLWLATRSRTTPGIFQWHLTNKTPNLCERGASEFIHSFTSLFHHGAQRGTYYAHPPFLASPPPKRWIRLRETNELNVAC